MQATPSMKKGIAPARSSSCRRSSSSLHGCSSSRSSKSGFGSVKADDCETSFRAVQDIAPFVEAVAEVIGKSRESVVVYDPYYCKGAVSAHWKKLGFKNFVNRDVDFYAQARCRETPTHDVLVTNPPYSGDHIRRLLDFATKPSRSEHPVSKNRNPGHHFHGSSGSSSSSSSSSSSKRSSSSCCSGIVDGKVVPVFTPFAILIPTHVLAQKWVGDLLQRRGLPALAYVAPSQQRYTFTCSPTEGPYCHALSRLQRVLRLGCE